MLQDSIDSGIVDSDEMKKDAVKESVTYTKTGETVSAEKGVSISVSV